MERGRSSYLKTEKKGVPKYQDAKKNTNFYRAPKKNKRFERRGIRTFSKKNRGEKKTNSH